MCSHSESFKSMEPAIARPAGTRITVAARLDRLPNSRYIRKLIFLLSLGACFEFYDLFFSAYIAPAFYSSGIFTPTTRGFLGIGGFASFVAALFAGLFVGTLVFSPVSDRYGRRTIFSFSLLWYSVCTFVMALQSTATAINLWRFLAGVGLGVEMITIGAYVSELAPKETRGRAFAFNQFLSFSAVPLAALISALLVPRHLFAIDGWRWVVIIGSSGAVFIWFIRRPIPESPRWLEQRGQLERADRIMDEIERRVRSETTEALPEPKLVEGETSGGHGSLGEIWNTRYRGRTALLIIFHVLQPIGFYGFASWVPTLLLAQGVGVTQSLQYTFVMALASPLGPLVGMAFADIFERKWQIAWSALAIAGWGILFARQKTAVGVIILGVLITLSSNWMSFSYHAYQSELYPTRIRTRAIGFVYSWSRLSTVFSSFLIAFFLRNYGTTGVFILIACSMLVVFALIGGFGPQTTRRRLEEIAG
ncbi:MAG TPA: MFS transporter [Terriglobales bacterium]|jgi:putative MFS transporter|nr:MFS transporter [Terriglobales bacterium]HZR65065.1 MFS transporter [Terriglobales bacterium]